MSELVIFLIVGIDRIFRSEKSTIVVPSSIRLFANVVLKVHSSLGFICHRLHIRVYGISIDKRGKDCFIGEQGIGGGSATGFKRLSGYSHKIRLGVDTYQSEIYKLSFTS